MRALRTIQVPYVLSMHMLQPRRTQRILKAQMRVSKSRKGSLGSQKSTGRKENADYLSELIKDRLDGDKIPGYLDGQSGNGRDNFLDEMCNDKKYWRPFLINLAGNSKHRNSKF